MARPRYVGVALLLALAVLVVVGQWRVAARHEDQGLMLVRNPPGVMGTTCTLAVVVARHEAVRGADALREAEQVLRRIEVLMSDYLVDSEVSRLCRAEADVEVALSSETLEVLRAARDAFARTDGTFDVTCRPQLELWRRAAERGETPNELERAEARAASHWGMLQLRGNGADKRAGSAGVDLGGIAKGYAIDQSLRVLKRAGARGALVDVGGDLACFGLQASGRPWQVDVQHPSQSRAAVRIQARDLAVATSGDYAHYLDIQGVRYSHIIDPRAGRPAQAARSATVVAPTAMAADVWATALSVLGTAGLARLPAGFEALLIVAHDDGLRLVYTPGFAALLDQETPEDWECWRRPDHTAIPTTGYR